MRIALAAIALAGAVGPAAAEEIYLFHLLHQPAYKRAYNAMLKSSPSVPKWVTAYSRTLNGPSQPSRKIKADGETYLLADVCKVHDCLDHKLHVIFAPGGQRAWGRLYENGSTSWIGSPSPALRKAAEGIEFLSERIALQRGRSERTGLAGGPRLIRSGSLRPDLLTEPGGA
ncbi:Ivy family c-type lysozyme inhibitor [Methylobacterium sp. B1]|uniref:Ivy family c-type lysozyme inhibitor n=1 Tax=Methylobacterium sp. B1 TaxID=91459 RepID=UPI00165170D9|nr:Ivy family c-type lysozyme inhibitor [Methylobacterium sp. B1]